MNKAVYLVWCTSGEYDDWSEWVDSVWESRSEAENRKEEYNSKIFRKEHYPIRHKAFVLEYAIGKIEFYRIFDEEE